MDYNDSIGMAQIGAAAIQTAGSILNSTFGYQSTKELASYQNEMNRENWNIQNEYNTPANQVKRLEEAGINPVLAYQNSADASKAGPMQPAQVGEPFQLDMSVLGNAINSVANVLRQKKELELLDKNIDAQEIRNRIAGFDLRRSALDYIFGYEGLPTEDGVEVYGLAGGVPNYVAPDRTSLAYQKQSKAVEQLNAAIALMGGKQSLTTEQIEYLKKQGIKLDADTKFVNSRTEGQGYSNKVASVDAQFAEIGKALGLSERGVKILQILLNVLK